MFQTHAPWRPCEEPTHWSSSPEGQSGLAGSRYQWNEKDDPDFTVLQAGKTRQDLSWERLGASGERYHGKTFSSQTCCTRWRTPAAYVIDSGLPVKPCSGQSRSGMVQLPNSLAEPRSSWVSAEQREEEKEQGDSLRFSPKWNLLWALSEGSRNEEKENYSIGVLHKILMPQICSWDMIWLRAPKAGKPERERDREEEGEGERGDGRGGIKEI